MSVDHALQYAGRGLAVFPVTRSKKPFKGSHGLLDATTDPTRIEELWHGRRGANVAVALRDMVVLDADGAKGLQALQQLAADVGHIPRTCLVGTPRGGLHAWYRLPAGTPLRSRTAEREKAGDDGLDWKSNGGYVLLPPSTTAVGTYRWIEPRPIADAPPELIAWLQENGGGIQKIAGAGSDSFSELGTVPAFLRCDAGSSLAQRALETLERVDWTAHEEARLHSALKCISAAGYDDWYQIGMALHHLKWLRSDGTDAGFDIWVDWGATCPDKFSLAASEQKWASFGRNTENRRTRTIASIYAKALEAGWTGRVEPLPEPEKPPKINGVHALPATLTQVQSNSIVFPDTNRAGHPTATCRNARAAIQGLGIECRHDLFHGKMLVGGHAVDQWAGEISDDALQMLRVAIERQYRFDPGLVNVHDAAVQECLQNGFDPIVDYLDGLEWDRRPRLGRWLHSYLEADDTPLNSETGALMLIAAVRRARAPGAKFDQIMVLEGKEGKNKSTAIEIMAGSENFSDQTILGAADREVQELLGGVWLYEIADLTGITRAETERVKAFASRKVDRARPAFGRTRVDRPRRCVFFATTNDTNYLRGDTGNRRFWPVRTGRVALEELARDRDQLWAEAATVEAKRGSLTLAESLWYVAAVQQEARREHDPWDDILMRIVPKETFDCPDFPGRVEYRISSRDLLEIHLRIPVEKQGAITAKRLAASMRRLGWDGPKVMWNERDNIAYRGYSRTLR